MNTQDDASSEQPQATKSSNPVRDKELARVLNQPYAKGDRKKAEEVLNLLDYAQKRIILPVDPARKGLGAINREGVTCWLDSLLFAMFGYLDNFESMLVREFSDESKERLTLVLRLYINLLRTGRLITTDIVRLTFVLHPGSTLDADRT